METLYRVPTSTYKYSYRGGRKTLPSIKYYQIQSILHRNARQQPPRQFPIEPTTPHRILQMDPEGPVIGLGTKYMNTQQFLEPKEITKTPSPQDIVNVPPTKSTGNFDVMPDLTERIPAVNPNMRKWFVKRLGRMNAEHFDTLVHDFRWTSNAAQARDGTCLPVIEVVPPTSTKEEKPDMIRLRGQRYENSVEEWQNAVFWDRIQLRGQVHHDDLSEKSMNVPEQILLKRIKEGTGKREIKPRINSAKLRHHIANNNINSIYVRQCPGYAGFIPRQPPKIEMERHPDSPNMTSVMKSSYREFPAKEYLLQGFARKGPLSKSVTLTYPFNPFNKVTSDHAPMKSPSSTEIS